MVQSDSLDVNLTIDTSAVRDILVHFIQDEIYKTGLRQAVVGLSGGIDSSLTCYLAAKALGPEHVLGVRMPYRASSQDSLKHAQMMIEATGVQGITVDITPMVEPLFECFPDADDVRRGNAMARTRMIVLYDQSAATNALVVGTGNKTELLLGYTTIYGDSASAINPLGDLYKTQVRQLAEYMELPRPIIDKAPSADLWVGQTDEAELGFAYEDADRLLYLLVDQRYSPDEAMAAGFEEEFVTNILERVRRNQFKRSLPIIAKLSERTP